MFDAIPCIDFIMKCNDKYILESLKTQIDERIEILDVEAKGCKAQNKWRKKK